MTRTWLVAVTALVTILVASAPAAAANVTVTQGDDRASVNRADNLWYEVCDREEDGNGVYGSFWIPNVTTFTVWDTNGSQAGCANGYLPAIFAGYTGSFRVCEDDWGAEGSMTGGDSCSQYKTF
ncbi:hypothetical protein QEZ54_27290 [Catellatospora sp. KI3]|uniref:hypothetical protein n=1 Tax=Catellatospora sp. KI3 TaxID=3041620 RepID=UPI00248229F6|nr:hypothetical protein [Catellatospora sp. KI3]MDI1464681.1 hypothetical protein [Catellatospora sp. KI3]